MENIPFYLSELFPHYSALGQLGQIFNWYNQCDVYSVYMIKRVK